MSARGRARFQPNARRQQPSESTVSASPHSHSGPVSQHPQSGDPADLDRTRQQFRRWAKSHDLFLHPWIEVLVPFRDMGNGIVATRAIAAGETLISCPHAAYIAPTDTAIPNCPAADALDKHRPIIADWTRVVLRVMAEQARGTASPWHPWLLTCEEVPEHLVTASPSVGESLWFTGIGQELSDLAIGEKWSQVESFAKANPEIWPETIATEYHFRQAAALVLSRNFHIEERKRCGPFLVPGVDLINHSSTQCNVSFSLRGGSRGTKFDVTALKDIPAGAQLFYNYGELNNARFLVEFGFIPDRNPHTGVRLSQRLLVSAVAACCCPPGLSEKEVATRMKYLDRLGLIFNEGVFILKGEDMGSIGFGEAEQLFLDVVFILSRPEKDYQALVTTLARWWHVPAGSATKEAQALAAKILQWLFDQYVTLNKKLEGEGEIGGGAPTSTSSEDAEVKHNDPPKDLADKEMTQIQHESSSTDGAAPAPPPVKKPLSHSEQLIRTVCREEGIRLHRAVAGLIMLIK